MDFTLLTLECWIPIVSGHTLSQPKALIGVRELALCALLLVVKVSISSNSRCFLPINPKNLISKFLQPLVPSLVCNSSGLCYHKDFLWPLVLKDSWVSLPFSLLISSNMKVISLELVDVHICGILPFKWDFKDHVSSNLIWNLTKTLFLSFF